MKLWFEPSLLESHDNFDTHSAMQSSRFWNRRRGAVSCETQHELWDMSKALWDDKDPADPEMPATFALAVTARTHDANPRGVDSPLPTKPPSPAGLPPPNSAAVNGRTPQTPAACNYLSPGGDKLGSKTSRGSGSSGGRNPRWRRLEGSWPSPARLPMGQRV
ncbi:hypothetical protein B0H67DRAFT_551132 [Lasiosphaeris hirsuta]|uniref:Uncharacterized protein n=1 Tax=Lasiosphaeris hirsuta TaxID=260670 RepID=A0AA40E7T1_9PEZI|nr:hypothetical protein B0H67DRAFT_551132 [Lasiosphaeris hirsuta]